MAYVNEISGSKLRSKLGYRLNESASAPTSSFAKQQLEKMGWSEGQGLGKRRQGMSSHIQVKKREDEIGLGHVEPALQQQHQWWNDGMSSVLARLSGGNQKVVTDEDLYKATDGKRFGMRARRNQTGKLSRTETVSDREEARAREKIEWNGQGEAKLILKEKTRKRKLENESVDVLDQSYPDQKEKNLKKTKSIEEKKATRKERKKKEKKLKKKKIRQKIKKRKDGL
mmetsp:Transcript_20116/g.30252  ORF Transcript_20116/g.30252 Transcript_20116/m.30252 type:complete len:227 (-) Transcript_20116:219-899(-)